MPRDVWVLEVERDNGEGTYVYGPYTERQARQVASTARAFYAHDDDVTFVDARRLERWEE